MAPREILVATRNRGKLAEIRACLEQEGIRVISLDAFPEISEVKEEGESFRENALRKAREVARRSGMITLADDSGLEVEALGGGPGVLSARFAGEGASDEDNNRKLLKMLEGVPWERRRAAFRCVIACVDPSSGKEEVVEGACEGVIGFEERGEGGFGYDPLFFIPELGKTMAELPLEVKNRLSHRGRALKALKLRLREFFP